MTVLFLSGIMILFLIVHWKNICKLQSVYSTNIMIRLIKQSRISRLYGSKLLRYYGNLKRPFRYAVLRLHHSTLYFDVVFCQLRHTCIAVRYKISGRQFLDLYRTINVQNALLKYVLKHAKI